MDKSLCLFRRRIGPLVWASKGQVRRYFPSERPRRVTALLAKRLQASPPNKESLLFANGQEAYSVANTMFVWIMSKSYEAKFLQLKKKCCFLFFLFRSFLRGCISRSLEKTLTPPPESQPFAIVSDTVSRATFSSRRRCNVLSLRQPLDIRAYCRIQGSVMGARPHESRSEEVKWRVCKCSWGIRFWRLS